MAHQNEARGVKIALVKIVEAEQYEGKPLRLDKGGLSSAVLPAVFQILWLQALSLLFPFTLAAVKFK